ncbi:hypothetical protein FSP39_002345 [Pinctada imbricata]|uniref:Integrase catalytic domain-containing protein n=1 Tax=Pinctada imbricata TaxID=66713 RepID=A0AA88Y2B1_PINIB|nr:hypothetical protein FSP39_002345 [Pinctada imbricata]
MASEHGDITEVVPEAKDDHDGQSGELPEKRFRTLTVKGKEQYDSIVQSYKAKLSKTCNEIHDSIVNSATCENDITVLQNVYKKLNGDFKRYSVDHYKFCTFLNGTRTEDSAHELEVQGGIFMTTQSKVESVCTKLDHTVQVLKEETKSHHPSIGSRHSVKSVKVETAKAKLRFAEQEAALTRKRAELEQEEKIRAAENERRKKELETEIGLLKLKEEVECDLLKAEEDNGNLPDDTQLPVEDTYDRTKSYVDGLLSTPVYNRPPENEFQPSFWHPSGHLPPTRKGFFVQSIDGREQLTLPTLTECQFIPNNRKEIPTRNVAQNYSHLKPIAEHIPPIDDNAHILLLIGRDLSAALHIEDQRIGLPYQPFAQKLKLGWVIIGESCLDGSHIPSTVNTMKTYVQSNGRTSFLEPCSSHFHVSFTNTEKSLFQVTKQDNKIGMSYEDKQFMHIMEDEMHLDDDNHWVAPLPFKQQRPSLPNNRTQALKRAKIFDSSIQKDLVKRQHVLEFMQKLLDNGHAERAPEIEPSSECWFLPLFGVYHPRKRDHIRIVFDSSARYQGVSLNDVLMSGPNLVNSLLGVLMRFRCGNVAIIADIQQMFYCFYVEPEHRDYLRFIWHEDNDLTKPLVDYRMKVHVFGNSPSPAIATFGLRKAADIAGETSGKDVKDYIYRNFYVDDALSSHDTSAEAIDLLSRTRSALQDNGSLRLHKICSNSSDVLVAFDPDDLAKDLKDLNLDSDNPPLQRSLGVSWDLRLDAFTFNVSQEEMPFTRRGMLSIVNGIYDPLGFAAPVTIHGKLILREVDTSEWDLPVHENIRRKFQIWKEGLNELRNVHISRPLTGTGSDEIKNLVIFSDASESAVAAVAFIHTRCGQSEQYRFVMGKSKVAPKNGHTIPRLELCAAVLAVDLYETIRDELNTTFENITLYTDSKVVLGYIHNETKRFYIYVRNRVDRIRQSTVPAQWRYVPSSKNPADEATRPFTSEHLQNSQWLNGPRNFYQEIVSEPLSSFPLVSPDLDSEIRSLKTTLVSKDIFGSERFEKYSSWTSLVNAITFLRKVAKRRKSDPEIASPQNSEEFIIKVVQREAFADEIIALQENRKLPRDSKILKLSPYLDSTGLLRVGGRISNANISSEEANPLIIPNHHIATLICRHYHAKVYHQGRTLTEGSIRNAGYWLIGGKRIVSSSIYKCVRCRRLRGRQTDQRMADLPFERLDPAPPFTYIGIDVFGPWTVSARKTRGGQVNSKRWGLIFTCMVVRAVHIEVLDEMSSSCFINALRRFCALRGEVKVIHSDRGTNFIGSTKDLNANVINIEDRPVKSYLTEHGINWVFNPPHSSHTGGVWERMIGVARRILDSILLDVKHLTHDVITTLMAEVTSIINARPLTPLTTDPEVPFPLTPSTLLNMKSDQSVKCFRIQDFNPRDLYTHQWRRVQHLANQFWSRWKREYLPTLQFREKWQQDCTNLKEGDIVVLRDNSEHRNDWPIGIIVKAYESADNRVRKVDVRLGRDRKIYTRPVKEVILLLSE